MMHCVLAGDPIELGAAQAVLLQGAQRTAPLQIAAAKSWLGHTEAASGVMGLLQAALGIAPGKQCYLSQNLHSCCTCTVGLQP